jgi:hypothetical protein
VHHASGGNGQRERTLTITLKKRKSKRKSSFNMQISRPGTSSFVNGVVKNLPSLGRPFMLKRDHQRDRKQNNRQTNQTSEYKQIDLID